MVIFPYFHVGIGPYPSIYEFPLHVADDKILRDSSTMTIRIDSDQNIYVGNLIVYFPVKIIRQRSEHVHLEAPPQPPPVIIVSQELPSDPPWQERLRAALQTEINKQPQVSVIVFQVEQDTTWDFIVTVCARVRNLSAASQYLQVAKEQMR